MAEEKKKEKKSFTEGKVYCPTCGADAKRDGFGRDFPRQLKKPPPKSTNLLHVYRRARAAAIRKQNGQ